MSLITVMNQRMNDAAGEAREARDGIYARLDSLANAVANLDREVAEDSHSVVRNRETATGTDVSVLVCEAMAGQTIFIDRITISSSANIGVPLLYLHNTEPEHVLEAPIADNGASAEAYSFIAGYPIKGPVQVWAKADTATSGDVMHSLAMVRVLGGTSRS